MRPIASSTKHWRAASRGKHERVGAWHGGNNHRYAAPAALESAHFQVRCHSNYRYRGGSLFRSIRGARPPNRIVYPNNDNPPCGSPITIRQSAPAARLDKPSVSQPAGRRSLLAVTVATSGPLRLSRLELLDGTRFGRLRTRCDLLEVVDGRHQRGSIITRRVAMKLAADAKAKREGDEGIRVKRDLCLVVTPLFGVTGCGFLCSFSSVFADIVAFDSKFRNSNRFAEPVILAPQVGAVCDDEASLNA